MKKTNETILEFNKIANDRYKERLQKLRKEFVYGGYKWVNVDDEIISLNTESCVLDSVASTIYRVSIFDPNECARVDLLQTSGFMNKQSSYRCMLETVFSMFYDMTILNVEARLIDKDEFLVTFTFICGNRAFRNLHNIYRRPGGLAAKPLLTTNDYYAGTIFPITKCTQYSNIDNLSKGLLSVQYEFDHIGNPNSEAYADDGLLKGIPLVSLMLTAGEYKTIKGISPRSEDDYILVTDLGYIINLIGCGNDAVGSTILWVSILFDLQHELENWTFNQAYDTPNTITCIRRFSMYAYDDIGGEISIVAESSVIGVMSEGLEAILCINHDAVNVSEDNKQEAEYTITYANGIDDYRIHASIAKTFEKIVFENLYNDECTFGWKLGEKNPSIYTGVLCVPESAKHESTTREDYVQVIKYLIKYHTYFFCPDKSCARLAHFGLFQKVTFGKKIPMDRFMYPIKNEGNLTIFKSYKKTKARKYRYVALLSTKDYTGTDFESALKTMLQVPTNNLSRNNPLRDPYLFSLITGSLKPYMDVDNRTLRSTFIGKRMLIIEDSSNDVPKSREKTL